MDTQLLKNTKIKNTTVLCPWCLQPARFIDGYLCPFQEEKRFFKKEMGIYYCPNEELGFAHPLPSKEELGQYYSQEYRRHGKLWQEDPHARYGEDQLHPTSRAQFMYISQFIDFSRIKKVIDMGCGHGTLLKEIADAYPDISLVGIELDPAVNPFLQRINAEIRNASIEESLDFICDHIDSETLLMNTHTLHYQTDYTYMNTIMDKVQKQKKDNVYLFIEVINSNLKEDRVYDVPQLIFFNPKSFQKIFDIHIINVSTCGIRREEFQAAKHVLLHSYQGGARPNIALAIAKKCLPYPIRQSLKMILDKDKQINQMTAPYSYGGDRSYLRMFAQITQRKKGC